MLAVMTRKRRLSSDDGFHRQCKTHVGEKELNSCQNGNGFMEAIYVSTLEKLFKAANQKTDVIVADSPALNLQATANPLYKQMFLNSKCQLQVSGNLKEVSSEYVCSFCANNICYNAKCSFCEKTMSVCRIQTCRKCSLQFCPLCIFSVYEDSEDCSLCISCY